MSVKVTLPVVFAPTTGAANVKGPMAAEPLARTREVVPFTEPVAVMVPEPVAVNVSTVPDTLALMAIGLFVPVSINERAPVAVIVLVTVIPPAADSVKLKTAAVEAPLPVSACVSVRVTLPALLAARFGVLRVSGPISPEPLLRATEVVPVIVPAPVMFPVVDAVIVSTVPETLAPIVMLPVAVVASNERVPVAVIVLLRVIAPVPPAVSVRLKLAPAEAPLPVIV